MLERLKRLVPGRREEVLAPPGLVAWGRAQRTLQPVEAWETFRAWIERDDPRFAFSVARGLVLGAATPEAERGWAALARQEARALFEGYERALIDKDVAVLDDTFWDAPHTIRYAIREDSYGFEEIHAHRVRRPRGRASSSAGGAW